MKAYKLALITGGSSGIGLALAKALARDGVDVCLLAQDKSKLARAKKYVEDYTTFDKQVIETISCDVTNYETLSQKLEHWTSESGIPDLVINSAGVTYPGYFQELDVDIFHWLMDINYFGTLHVLKVLIPMMIERGSGTVVNISSIAGYAGIFGYTGYSASKYAVRGFTDTLRSEMKPLGIKVSIVFPPDTQTPQLDFEEPLQPMETKILNGKADVFTADEVAASIMKGIKKGKYVITHGFKGKFLYRLNSLAGDLKYPLLDWWIRGAQKKKKNK